MSIETVDVLLHSSGRKLGELPLDQCPTRPNQSFPLKCDLWGQGLKFQKVSCSFTCQSTIQRGREDSKTYIFATPRGNFKPSHYPK